MTSFGTALPPNPRQETSEIERRSKTRIAKKLKGRKCLLKELLGVLKDLQQKVATVLR